MHKDINVRADAAVLKSPCVPDHGVFPLRRGGRLQFELQRFVVEKLGPQRPILEHFVAEEFLLEGFVVPQLCLQRLNAK